MCVIITQQNGWSQTLTVQRTVKCSTTPHLQLCPLISQILLLAVEQTQLESPIRLRLNMPSGLHLGAHFPYKACEPCTLDTINNLCFHFLCYS